MTAINQLLQCSENMMQILKENISIAIANDNSKEIDEINAVLKQKQKELVKLAHERKSYSDLADKIECLQSKKQKLLITKAETESFKKRIAELESFLKTANQMLTGYDEAMVRKYIRQITIYDDKFVVCFKAKVEIEVLR